MTFSSLLSGRAVRPTPGKSVFGEHGDLPVRVRSRVPGAGEQRPLSVAVRCESEAISDTSFLTEPYHPGMALISMSEWIDRFGSSLLTDRAPNEVVRDSPPAPPRSRSLEIRQHQFRFDSRRAVKQRSARRRQEQGGAI